MALEIGTHTFPASAVNPIIEPRSPEPDSASNANKREANGPTNVQEKEVEHDLSEVKKTVSQLNDTVRNIRRELHFSVDESSGRVVVKVINAEDGETIRQIPSEELLRLAKHFNEGETEGRLLEVIA